MPAWELGPKVSRMPGFTVCRRCRAVVDNGELVHIRRPGKAKGLHCCQICADRLTGGKPDVRCP